MKDPGTAGSPVLPTPNNFITVNRYHVSFTRADGRNTPGVDVPHPWDGTVTFTVNTQVTTFPFLLVRHQTKEEAPLAALANGGGANLITTLADITFYGQDQTGRDVSVSTTMTVIFGNFEIRKVKRWRQRSAPRICRGRNETETIARPGRGARCRALFERLHGRCRGAASGGAVRVRAGGRHDRHAGHPSRRRRLAGGHLDRRPGCQCTAAGERPAARGCVRRPAVRRHGGHGIRRARLGHVHGTAHDDAGIRSGQDRGSRGGSRGKQLSERPATTVWIRWCRRP